MDAATRLPVPDAIVGPGSEGSSLGELTKQARWIAILVGNLSAMFRDRPDVFVAADLCWYPVEGDSEERLAPDVFVVFGRPPGDRGSYRLRLSASSSHALRQQATANSRTFRSVTLLPRKASSGRGSVAVNHAASSRRFFATPTPP